MDRSDKTASLDKSINMNILKVVRGKNQKYVVVCSTVFFMEGRKYYN